MINFLSSWVKNLCLALIVVSILEMLLPNNKTKKYVKMVMGLYILFSIIEPFIENSNELKFNVEDLYNQYSVETLAESENVNQKSMDSRLDELYKQKLENDIGYLEITSFDEGVAEDFKAKYLSLKEQGIKGLVIDLRDNGGGLVAEALKIVDYIVPKDQTALITVDKDGKEEISKTKEDAIITEPIVLLVNSSSASASEIMAGALKDLKCATIVGTKTYGKGVIQQLLTLSNGAGLKITVEEYYTPNKTKINKVGITPDYEILLETSITREPTDANDTQLNKAKEILKAKIEN